MTTTLAQHAAHAATNGHWYNTRINLDREETNWNEKPVSGDHLARQRWYDKHIRACTVCDVFGAEDGCSEGHAIFGNDTNENTPNTQETKTMTLDQHIENYIENNDNNVSYIMPYAIKEYLNDYASINDGATYDDVETALNTLDDNYFGEYGSYREVTEAMLEAQGADPIPEWITVDYKQTWESDLRHMLNIVGDIYNGDGYYFTEH